MKLLKNPYVWLFIFYILIEGGTTRCILYLTYIMDTQHDISFQRYLSEETALRFQLNFYLKIFIVTILPLISIRLHLFHLRSIHIKPRDGLYAFYAGIAKMLFGIILVLCLRPMGFSLETENQNVARVFFEENPFRTAFMVVIIAPIMEELMFRKVIIGHIFSNRKYVGIIVSSLLFGAVHMLSGFSLLPFLNFTIFALILGYFYIKTERIETTIMIHFFSNLFALLIMFLS